MAALLVAALEADVGPPRLTLQPSPFAALAGWGKDRVAAALPAFLRSCARFLEWPDSASFFAVASPVNFGRVGDWRPLCMRAKSLPPGNDALARRFFEADFVPMAVADDGERDGLFTGYFEIELDGSRRRHGRFQTPIYRRPRDPALATRYSRAEIENGALARYGLAFLWVDDPVAAFFTQIQGSGRVRLDGGKVIRIGYDGDNGHTYVAVGRLLVEHGDIARRKLSMATIRDWMIRHPIMGTALRRADPSYVFFRESSGAGPVGAEQVVLSPRRSIAVDPSFIPFGVPLWLEAEERYAPGGELRRLVIAQDAGGAIKGPVRGDLFWGNGVAAGAKAGEMNATGRYFLLLPRAVADHEAESNGVE